MPREIRGPLAVVGIAFALAFIAVFAGSAAQPVAAQSTECEFDPDIFQWVCDETPTPTPAPNSYSDAHSYV